MSVAAVVFVADDTKRNAPLIDRLRSELEFDDATVVPPGRLAATLAQAESPAVVVAVGGCVEEVLRLAADTGGVGGLCLIGGTLDVSAVQLVAEWPDLPLLTVVDPADRHLLASMVDAYLASMNAASDLLVGPVDSVIGAVGDWVERCRRSMARVDHVSFVTEDGWTIRGTRSLPAGRRSPGVVLLHSGRSDRGAYARLERLLVTAGFAVLNIDWRGRGESIDLGSYFELSDEVKFAAWRDAVAAIEHLASCDEVNGERVGVVGVVHGAEYAARAAHRDPRVKALVLLTGYRPVEPEESIHLVSGAVEVLYVTSTAHRATSEAMRDLCDRSPGRSTQLVEYSGGAIGYQLFDLDPTLEPRIVGWLKEVLVGLE